MGTPTYQPIANITLASNTSSVTFSGITQQYRDLVFVFVGKGTGGANLAIRPNNDTSSNYALVRMLGYSGGAASSSSTAENYYYVGGFGSTVDSIITMNIMDYSASDKHKTALAAQDIGGDTAMRIATRWAVNSPITSLVLTPSGNQFASGSTFALYGVIA